MHSVPTQPANAVTSSLAQDIGVHVHVYVHVAPCPVPMAMFSTDLKLSDCDKTYRTTCTLKLAEWMYKVGQGYRGAHSHV